MTLRTDPEPMSSVARGFSTRGRLVCTILLCIALAGCLDRRGGTIPYNPTGFKEPDVALPVTKEGAYRTAPGDTLTVAVTRVPDLSGDITVDPSGDISLPLIGKVTAMGKTTDELAADIAQRLGKDYLRNPEVRVLLKTASDQRITVDGSVGQPGVYAIAGSTTLIQAVAIAHGTTQDANPRRVVVFRTIDGKRQAASFDLTDIRRGLMDNPQIFGNDIIVVDGSVARSRFKDILSAVPLVALFRPF